MKTDPSQGVGLTSVLLSKLAVEKKWHMVVDCELTYVVLARRVDGWPGECLSPGAGGLTLWTSLLGSSADG